MTFKMHIQLQLILLKENILEKDAENLKKKKIKLATQETNNKIENIKQNANKEIDILNGGDQSNNRVNVFKKN